MHPAHRSPQPTRSRLRSADRTVISFRQIKPSPDLKLRLRMEDRRDHLVRRPVANPAEDEQHDEAKDELRQ
jgi:hypothetical protein